ncbi:MAG: hypothetical protein AAF683_10570, partial [Pseudomonadota bacterium]
ALLKSGAANIRLIGAAIMWGFIGHVILFAGLFASNVFELVPLGLYYCVLILWGVVPTIVFREKTLSHS